MGAEESTPVMAREAPVMPLMDRPEVLVVTMASGRAWAAIFAWMSRFRSIRSKTASMIQSASFTAARFILDVAEGDEAGGLRDKERCGDSFLARSNSAFVTRLRTSRSFKVNPRFRSSDVSSVGGTSMSRDGIPGWRGARRFARPCCPRR